MVTRRQLSAKQCLGSRPSGQLRDVDALDRALQALEPIERHTIELIYFKHQTQRDIANVLTVPLDTVKTAVARGLQKLARLLENEPA